MKLGVFLALFNNQKLETALDYVKQLGLDTVEVGTGNYPGDPHCNARELLKSQQKRKQFKSLFESRGMQISALSCHANTLHPDRKIAKQHGEIQRNTIELAAELGIPVVISFSGCPGGGPKDTRPNWVTCPWPPDFLEILEWQWQEKVIPFWTEESKFAQKHGVRIALEMHPGFVVYNTETMLKLRKACGKNIGANFDPSHLWWQGMDPNMSVRELKDAIFHVHAKDTRIDALNTARNGVLDTKHYGKELERSWIFRTVGFGHGESFWRDFVSTLRMIGYDGAVSVEHEDSLMSVNEGLTKAVEFLKGIILKESTGAMWWA